MSNLNGDIIISGVDGTNGIEGQGFSSAAPSGNNGTDAHCDWDSVCRPHSSAGTAGANGAEAGSGSSGGNGGDCPSVNIVIGQLSGSLLVAAAAGDGAVPMEEDAPAAAAGGSVGLDIVTAEEHEGAVDAFICQWSPTDLLVLTG